MIRRSFTFIACAAALSCATTPGRLTLGASEELTADDYERILQRWTRSDRLYKGLETKLFVDATFLSPEFRKAFILRHQDIYGQGSEIAGRLALTDPSADEAIDFFFSAYTPDVDWNDFDEEDSIWRVTIQTDGSEPVPGEVLKARINANLRVIFPYIGDFSRAYVVIFPRTNEAGAPLLTSATQRVVLRFVSALGEATLEWLLTPTAGVPPPGAG